ncbi:hypothetical protein ACXR2U_17185 [Jatrophihabitans sp. YIM 134969]
MAHGHGGLARLAGWLALAPTRGGIDDPQLRPGSSDVNFGTGVTPNAVLATLGDGGMTSSTGSGGAVAANDPPGPDLVDVAGVFVQTPQPAVGLWNGGLNVFHDTDEANGWDRAMSGAPEDVVEVVGSIRETAVLRQDGTVLRWGDRDTDPVILTTNAGHIAASDYGIYVLRADGSVWTDDASPGAHGVPGRVEGFSPVVGVSDAVSIEVRYGSGLGLAIQSDGRVVGWGGRAPAARQVGGLPGPVTAVGLDHDGRVCTSFADGSVEIRSRVLPAPATARGVDARTVVGFDHGYGTRCLVLDSSHRIHLLTPRAEGVDDLVLDSPPATAVVGNETRVQRFDGAATPVLRMLAVDGSVWDLEADGSGGVDDLLWRHVPGLDGATAISGVWSLNTFVPPSN